MRHTEPGLADWAASIARLTLATQTYYIAMPLSYIGNMQENIVTIQLEIREKLHHRKLKFAAKVASALVVYVRKT